MKEEKFESIQTKIVEPIFRLVHDAVNFRLLREENKIDTYFYSMLGKSGRHCFIVQNLLLFILDKLWILTWTSNICAISLGRIERINAPLIAGLEGVSQTPWMQPSILKVPDLRQRYWNSTICAAKFLRKIPQHRTKGILCPSRHSLGDRKRQFQCGHHVSEGKSVE